MKKVISSGMIGNSLEWYDYALYGHFAPVMSVLFFPNTNYFVALMSVFAIYLVGFIMRPVGALCIGMIGDKYGRRSALSISIMMMAIPTALISILPTYDTAGVLAPLGLILIRLLQGASMGGEFGGSMTFLVEHAPKDKRGLIGSMSVVSLGLGVLCGSGVAYIVKHNLSHADFIDWGWRLPFAISIIFGLVGYYIRSSTTESEIYSKAKAAEEVDGTSVDDKGISFKRLFNNYRIEIVIGILLSMTVCVPFHTLTVFMGTFISKILGQDFENSLLINTISVSALTISCVLSGYISDKIGRKPVLFTGAVILSLWSWPAFYLLENGDFVQQLIAELVFGIGLGIFFGSIPAALVELFPTKYRYTGLSFSYNMSITLFGGTLPLIATSLIEFTGFNSSVAFYLIATSLCSMSAVYFMKETYKDDLK